MPKCKITVTTSDNFGEFKLTDLVQNDNYHMKITSNEYHTFITTVFLSEEKYIGQIKLQSSA
tara:strand:+ start:501 stop:686 length:186 start_codon:yes stop_codon:yes gene_type:complete